MSHMGPTNAMMDGPYYKTLQDELDWKLLDQLYGVVAQISSFCFETKKFCVTTEFVVLTLMIKFTEGHAGPFDLRGCHGDPYLLLVSRCNRVLLPSETSRNDGRDP
jgi:hypothetical protein